MRTAVLALTSNAVSIDDKVAFLSRAAAYPHPVHEVLRRETHMSWVFLAGEAAYKLKKPVRFPYLDFSTLARREAACRAELTLNRRLAPDVYETVVALVRSPQGLAIGGAGEIIDWLVVMRRLDETQTFEHALVTGHVADWQLDRLLATLVGFYRRASAVLVSPQAHLSNWRYSLSYNRQVLLDSRLRLPAGMIRQIDRAQRRFMAERWGLIADRVRHRHIIFYRCHRATLRARLAIAHLLEPNPRSPQKWPALAHAYLQLAAHDATQLERMLRTRAGR